MPDITAHLAAHQARVEGLFIAGSSDGTDPDTDVDLTPLQGLTITLTPSVRVVELPHLTPPATLVLRTWALTTDDQGRLTNPETGEVGVAIPSSDVASDDPDRPVVWTSTIAAPDTSVPSITKHWVAPAGETVDLTSVESIPGVTPINLTQWQRLVADARGAKDLAVAASTIAVDARDKAAASEAAAAASATTAAASASSASDSSAAAADSASSASDSSAAAAASASSAATSASTATAARDATLAASTIVGAGRPDVPASMTAAVQTLVSAATSGAVFRSTDGPQGAWEWRKRGSTWVCIEGDTDWRAVPLLNGWAGSLTVRRIGNTVFLAGTGLDPTGATSTIAAELPAAFRVLSANRIPVPCYRISGGVLNYARIISGLSLQVDYTTNTGARDAAVSFATSDLWPTTLPGSPS